MSSAQKKHVRRKKQKEMEDQAIDEVIPLPMTSKQTNKQTDTEKLMVKTEVKNKQRDEFIQHAKQEYEDYQLEMMHDEVPVKPKTAEEAKKVSLLFPLLKFPNFLSHCLFTDNYSRLR